MLINKSNSQLSGSGMLYFTLCYGLLFGLLHCLLHICFYIPLTSGKKQFGVAHAMIALHQVHMVLLSCHCFLLYFRREMVSCIVIKCHIAVHVMLLDMLNCLIKQKVVVTNWARLCVFFLLIDKDNTSVCFNPCYENRYIRHNCQH